jgi:mRNA interferase RelE/StbE
VTFRLAFKRSAAKELAALPKAAQHRIRARLLALAESPSAEDTKALQGHTDLFRLRVGDYRIIYRVDGAELLILIIKVGHRRDIYRGL